MTIARTESPEQRTRRLARNREWNRRNRKSPSALERKREKWAERKAALAVATDTKAEARRVRDLARRAAKRAAARELRQAETDAAQRAARLVAGGQPLPECPRERELFLALQSDAKIWRDREAPNMPTDPARYLHGEQP